MSVRGRETRIKAFYQCVKEMTPPERRELLGQVSAVEPENVSSQNGAEQLSKLTGERANAKNSNVVCRYHTDIICGGATGDPPYKISN